MAFMVDGERNGFTSLVLVSHGAPIAAGLAELVSQVAGPDVSIVAIGGASDGSLGTDGARVLQALREVAVGAGAVVLMDIGSSVLAVRAALAELERDELGKLFVADAPLVEGAVAAGVAAAAGAAPAEVAQVAAGARHAAKL